MTTRFIPLNDRPLFTEDQLAFYGLLEMAVEAENARVADAVDTIYRAELAASEQEA